MGIFLVYVLKSAVYSTLFCLFYRLWLSKETFYRFNRGALLGILFLSLLLPLAEVNAGHPAEANQTLLTVGQLIDVTAIDTVSVSFAEGEEADAISSWLRIAALLFWVGVIVFVCRYCYSLLQLWLLIKSGKRETVREGVALIVHEREIAPFSWMKYIVISRNDLEQNGHEILLHEMAHVRCRHSLDLWLADIYLLFQWFNPGAWLLKRELQDIHEYEADEMVVRSGVNAKQYQLLLIRKTVGARRYSMVNSFNHGTLKKRITMMLKEKSNSWARLKYLYVLPLAAVTMSAFARPAVSEKVETLSAIRMDDVIAVVGDSFTATEDSIVTHGTSPKESARPAQKESPKNDKKAEFWIRAAGKGTSDSLSQKPLIIIDGVEMKGEAPLSEIKPEEIESFSVLKDKSALQVYGEKGKNGVILIERKKYAKELEKTLKEKETGDNEIVVDVDSARSVLILVDGREMSAEKLNKIDPDRIKSFSVLTGQSMVAAYGEKAKGKDKVMVVTLCTDEEYEANKKKPKKDIKDRKDFSSSFPEGVVPLIIVDGKEMSKSEFDKIDSDRIESMVIFTEGEFLSKYGEKGKNGVVEVSLYTDEKYKARKKARTPEVNVNEDFKKSFPKGTPLILLDGKEISQEEFDKLDADRIREISILKDKSAASLYGEKGKNGVILISLYTDEEYKARMDKEKKENANEK